jgi:hypothetical protein
MMEEKIAPRQERPRVSLNQQLMTTPIALVKSFCLSKQATSDR